MITRVDIVMEARRWLGVRYKHQGRTVAGVDCAGLIIKVAHNLRVSKHDETNYARRPHGHDLMNSLNTHAIRVQREALPGDILLFSFQGFPQHLGIRTDKGIIHSFATARKVVEHTYDNLWRSRLVYVYEFPGVID
jgi:cell wall-associated NlpC family hydrolase